MGAGVIVTEIDPIKALEAAMDGFYVTTMDNAATVGDIFCTVTGNIDVLTERHFKVMKDGAIVCNSGHFDVEISIKDLQRLGGKPKRVRDNVDEYVLRKLNLHNKDTEFKGVKRIYLLSEGRLVNLAAAEGHPASVMDMSFATQALGSAWMATQAMPLAPGVYEIPEETEQMIAKLKLSAMGSSIDELTNEQKKYLASWQEGT